MRAVVSEIEARKPQSARAKEGAGVSIVRVFDSLREKP